MIHKVTKYEITCDNCFINLGDIEDLEIIRKIAFSKTYNWIENINNNLEIVHYCPECYYFDENGRMIVKELDEN